LRFVAFKRPIPARWSGHPKAGGLVAEADIYPHPHGRVAAKLLVFRNPTALQRFWRDGLGKGSLGRECRGAVNALARQGEDWRKGRDKPDRVWLEGDRRYFCVIGLCLGYLSMEVVSHEAVHAAYCYEKRVGRNLFGNVGDFDEERIAYPAGRIADAINRFLYKKGLYPPPEQASA
jgi:hypothetical protein